MKRLVAWAIFVPLCGAHMALGVVVHGLDFYLRRTSWTRGNTQATRADSDRRS